MLQLLFNLIQCDAPRPGGIYFQDSAASDLEGLVELHDKIMFYLVLILFGVGWLLTSVIVNFTSSKSPISHKYLNHGKLIEWIIIITPAIILIASQFLKSEYLLEGVEDSGGVLTMGPSIASSLDISPWGLAAGVVGGAAIWLIWGLNREGLTDQGARVIENVNNENRQEMGRMLEESNAIRFGIQEGAVNETVSNLYIGVIQSNNVELPGVWEVSRQVFTNTMTWLVSDSTWELISTGTPNIEFTIIGGLFFQIFNFRVIVDIWSQYFNTDMNIRGILSEMLYTFGVLAENFTLDCKYVSQPILYTIINSKIIFMNPTSVYDSNLDIGDRYDYRILVTETSHWERRRIGNSRNRFIEIFDGNINEFYEDNPEEVEDFDDWFYEDEEPPAK